MYCIFLFIPKEKCSTWSVGHRRQSFWLWHRQWQSFWHSWGWSRKGECCAGSFCSDSYHSDILWNSGGHDIHHHVSVRRLKNVRTEDGVNGPLWTSVRNIRISINVSISRLIWNQLRQNCFSLCVVGKVFWDVLSEMETNAGISPASPSAPHTCSLGPLHITAPTWPTSQIIKQYPK